MKRPRGVCPVCQRELSLRDDRTLPHHNASSKRPKNAAPEPCAGSCRQPADQAVLDWEAT